MYPVFSHYHFSCHTDKVKLAVIRINCFYPYNSYQITLALAQDFADKSSIGAGHNTSNSRIWASLTKPARKRARSSARRYRIRSFIGAYLTSSTLIQHMDEKARQSRNTN
ncbi:hypothetical protein JOE11_000703 [Robbsia andropogonis]